MSIADKLTRLRTAHTNIINAIINKGVSATGHGFEDFAADIEAIPQGGITPTGTINITSNGTHNVYNYASALVAVPGGGTYQEKTVTPTAAGFDVEPDSGYDALSKVTVSGDADLVASNVKSGVEIFGVTGTYAPRILARSDVTIEDTQIPEQLVYTLPALPPAMAYDGQSGFRVNIPEGEELEYTPEADTVVYTFLTDRQLVKQIQINGDENLVAGNIKKDVEIFGVTGTYEQTTQEKTITPTAAGTVVVPDSGYDALSSVTINGDSNLIADNVKKNITIFGITGSYEGLTAGSLIVCTCTSAFTSVDVYYGTESQINVYMENYVAYAIIPHTYTGVVTLKGHYTYYDETTGEMEERIAETTVTISSIKEYDCEFNISTTIYDSGTWYGVETHDWQSWYGHNDVEENSNSLLVTCSRTSSDRYFYHVYMDTPIITRGYGRIKITVSAVTGLTDIFFGISPAVPSHTTTSNPYSSYVVFTESGAHTYELSFDVSSYENIYIGFSLIGTEIGYQYPTATITKIEFA